MNNRLVRVVRAAALILSAAVLAASAAVAQAGAAPAADAQAQMKAQMEMFAKLAAPGEHHKRLGGLVGKWNLTGKSWMAPGQPPIELTSTMEASWILGGRYVQSVYHGSFMGQPFEGRAIDGYDNASNQYVGSWVDNMGTGVMSFRGTCDNPCKTLTETAEAIDPMTGKMAKERNVTIFVDDNTFRMEMYMVGAGPGGQDVKSMEMVATRQH